MVEHPNGAVEETTTTEHPDGSIEISASRQKEDGSKELYEKSQKEDGTYKENTVSLNETGEVTEILLAEKTDSGKTTMPCQPAGEKALKIKNIKTTEKEIVIPKTITPADEKTYKLTAVADNAMKANKTVKKLTVGNNIQTIGKSAFRSCSKLTTVKFSKKLKDISNDAFRDNGKLSGVSLPVTVKNIGDRCFKNCKKMKKFVLGAKSGSMEDMNRQGKKVVVSKM